MRSETEELVAASKAMLNGIHEEDIDTHIRNLMNRLDDAIKAFEAEGRDNVSIIYLSKDDIRQAMLDGDDKLPPDVEARIEGLNDLEMKKLASKLSDDYCEQLFWISLRSIFDGMMEWEKKHGESGRQN
jgi:hypothetical protein